MKPASLGALLSPSAMARQFNRQFGRNNQTVAKSAADVNWQRLGNTHSTFQQYQRIDQDGLWRLR